MAQPRSYRESDAEDAGIKAHYAAQEKKHLASLTWQQLCVEGMESHLASLSGRLKRAQEIAATIPITEAQIEYEKDKLMRFRKEHGL